MKLGHLIPIAALVTVISVIAVWAHQDAAAQQKAKDDYAAYQESITPKVLGSSCKDVSRLIVHCVVKMDYGKSFGHDTPPYYGAVIDGLLLSKTPSNGNKVVVTSDSGNTTVIIKFTDRPYAQNNDEPLNLGSRLAQDMHGFIFEGLAKASYYGYQGYSEALYTVILHKPLAYGNVNVTSMLNMTQRSYDYLMEKEWSRPQLDVNVKINSDSSVTLHGIRYVSEIAEAQAATAAASARAQWCHDHTYRGVVGGRDAYLAPESCY